PRLIRNVSPTNPHDEVVVLRVAISPSGGRAALHVASDCDAGMPACNRTIAVPPTILSKDSGRLVAPRDAASRSRGDTRCGLGVRVRELFAVGPWPRRAPRLGWTHR